MTKNRSFISYIFCFLISLLVIGCSQDSEHKQEVQTKKTPHKDPDKIPTPVSPNSSLVTLINLKDVKKHVNSKSLVIFDLDETLILAPGHFPSNKYPILHSLQWTETNSKEVFASVKEKAHTVTGLTARRVNLNSPTTGDNSKHILDWLEIEGMTFASISDANLSYFQYKGVTFTEHQEKGPVLKKMLDDSSQWSHIVFIDDKKSNLESVRNALHNFRGKLTLIHYIGAGKSFFPEIHSEHGEVYQQIPAKINFASGWHSIVSMIYHPGNDLLYSHKKAKPGPSHLQALSKEIDQRFPMWKKYNLVPSEYTVTWDHSRTGLIKSYLEGTFLIDYFKKDAFFWKKNAYNQETRALKDFFAQLIRKKVFVKDLSTENLIYLNSRWYIIDSSTIVENQPLGILKDLYRSPSVYGSLADKWHYTINRNISDSAKRSETWRSAQELIESLMF